MGKPEESIQDRRYHRLTIVVDIAADSTDEAARRAAEMFPPETVRPPDHVLQWAISFKPVGQTEEEQQ